MEELEWIDIGVNLTDSAFDKDRNAVIDAAAAAGVTRMLLTGTSLAESEQAIALAERYPGQLFCTVGVHPHYSKDHSSADFRQLASLLRSPGVVAVGETGLDFNRNFSTPAQQESAFEHQLELACDSGLPLFLHERDAHERQVEMLKHYRNHISGAVAHCFTGDKQALYNYLDLDLYIGITGWICDERRGVELQTLIKDIPANRLLLETDAPYLIPRDIQPKPKSRRNMPQYLPHIANKVAELTAQPLAALATQVKTNTELLFRLNAQP
ncbi:TatD family hydrolase [Pontibacter sp. JAM-7]|uniref:TatD family hydrolase n=1 Tax=Pontibacter sp. JAM-7 TaxID=3366581 RepID=UPI003AF4B6E5